MCQICHGKTTEKDVQKYKGDQMYNIYITSKNRWMVGQKIDGGWPKNR